MSEWFRQAFGEEYLELYAHRNDEEAAGFTELILRETGCRAGMRVLDAPCGAGRYMRALESAGLRAFGFDLSKPLLRNALDSNTRRGTFVRGDMRAIPFHHSSFDLVVNLFSSLGYFDDDAINFAVISDLIKLCRQGGWLVIDFMNSHHVRQNLQPESHRTLANGTEVYDRRWIDGAPPRVSKETILRAVDGQTITLNESVRLFTPEELLSQVKTLGLKVEKTFGDYSGTPFDDQTSSRLIIMGKRV